MLTRTGPEWYTTGVHGSLEVALILNIIPFLSCTVDTLACFRRTRGRHGARFEGPCHPATKAPTQAQVDAGEAGKARRARRANTVASDFRQHGAGAGV